MSDWPPDRLQYQSLMSCAEMEAMRNTVPDFVLKLYCILERKQYGQYIAWAENQSDVHIKDIRGLQRHVLPQFFRHNKIGSFIRQLNMYNFKKVNQLTRKQKELQFKNQYFRRGQMNTLIKVQRKKRGTQDNQSEGDDTEDYPERRTMAAYEKQVRRCAKKIYEELDKFLEQNPHMAHHLKQSLSLSKILADGDIIGQSGHSWQELPRLASSLSFASVREGIPWMATLQKICTINSIEETPNDHSEA